MNILLKVYYKFKIDIAVNRLMSAFTRIFWKQLEIMNVPRTIDYIIENKASIARFGDGNCILLHMVAH